MNPWDNYTPYNTWAMNRFGHNQWNSEAYNNIFRPFQGPITEENQYYDKDENPDGWRFNSGNRYSSTLFNNPNYIPGIDYTSLSRVIPMPSGRPQPGPGDSAFRWMSQTRGW